MVFALRNVVVGDYGWHGCPLSLVGLAPMLDWPQGCYLGQPTPALFDGTVRMHCAALYFAG
jgi:hypothetical protein